jgi:hypothetical protein
MKMEESVPKRRHIKFRRRGITQKETYNILLIFIFTTVELIPPSPHPATLDSYVPSETHSRKRSLERSDTYREYSTQKYVTFC